MKLYRFSPIETEGELRAAIEYVHVATHNLCKQVFGETFATAGNLAVFCHYQNEYEALTKIREALTDESDNWNQKYFKLHEPIVFAATDTIQETSYEYLYIRKPDPYRVHVGNIDFYVPDGEYLKLKEGVRTGTYFGARMFPDDRVDMIELHDPDSDVLVYVSNKKAAEEIRKTKTSHSPA